MGGVTVSINQPAGREPHDYSSDPYGVNDSFAVGGDSDPIGTLPGDDREWWIFSFGIGQPYADRYVKMHGHCDGTRDVMFRHFGREWSRQYRIDTDAARSIIATCTAMPPAEWPAAIDGAGLADDWDPPVEASADDQGPGRDQHGTHERATMAQRLADAAAGVAEVLQPLVAEMNSPAVAEVLAEVSGPAYVVDPREMVGLPAPNFFTPDAWQCLGCGATWGGDRAAHVHDEREWGPISPEVRTAEFDDRDEQLVRDVRQLIFDREQLNPDLTRDTAARRIIALVREADSRSSHAGTTVSADLTAERFGTGAGEQR